MDDNVNAIKMWEEKLRYLQLEEAKISNANQKFELKYSIEECQQKINQLRGKPIEQWIENEDEKQEKQELAKIPSPSYFELLGREKEIEVIKNVLADSTSKRLVGITGLGGNGKTSFAIEVARSFREMGFQNIVWQTASTKRRATPMSFDTVIDGIAKQLGNLELLTLQGEELERKTRERLLHSPVLIVLDNMETSGDNQNEIAAKISPILGNSKVIFTSRNRFETLETDVFDYCLKGLKKEASIKLMEQTSQERNIYNFHPNDCESLLQLTGNSKTGYLPLALKLVTGKLQGNKSPSEIARSLEDIRLTEENVEADNVNVFRKFWWHMFFQSFNMLSESELNLMLFVASLKEQDGTTQDVLLSLTREILTEEQFRRATDNTWRLCLLEREEYRNQRYYVHILTSKFFNTILAYGGRINK